MIGYIINAVVILIAVAGVTVLIYKKVKEAKGGGCSSCSGGNCSCCKNHKEDNQND